MAKKKATKKRAPRDYSREYSMYHSTDEQKKNRAKRNGARRKAIKAGRVKKGDGKEVHHTGGIKKKATRVVSRRANRVAGSPGKRARKR